VNGEQPTSLIQQEKRGQPFGCPRCLKSRLCGLIRPSVHWHLTGQLYSASMAGSAISEPSPARPVAKIV